MRVEFGAHIGLGGARESSRHAGRNAEKAAAWPIRAGLPANLSLTAPAVFPQQRQALKTKRGVCGGCVDCPLLLDSCVLAMIAELLHGSCSIPRSQLPTVDGARPVPQRPRSLAQPHSFCPARTASPPADSCLERFPTLSWSFSAQTRRNR